MSISPELLASVKIHEGFRKRAYQDSVGVWTIGYGTNLQELEIDEEQAAEFLWEKLRQARVSAGGYPWFKELNAARQEVITEMIYNLGLPRFDKFAKLKLALSEKRWAAASEEMLASVWAEQVGVRALRLATQMRTGERWQ
jgi:lysozyme